MPIRQVTYEDLKAFKSRIAKERVTLHDTPTSTWFGYYIDCLLVGFIGADDMGTTIRLKSGYVLEQYRGQKIYSQMLQYALLYFMKKNYKVYTAFALPQVLPVLLKLGFKKLSERHGISFVRKKI